jgi:HNH endonuclease
MSIQGVKPMFSKKRVQHLHSLYRRGYSLNELAEIFGVNRYPIWSGFVRHGLKRRPRNGCQLRTSIRDQVFDRENLLPEKEVERLRSEFLKLPKLRSGCRGYAERFVQALYSDYVQSDEVLVYVARRWGRSPGAIAEMFAKRGLRSADPTRRERVLARQRVDGTGCFARIKRATRKEIEAIIDQMVSQSRRKQFGRRRGASKFSIPLELKWEFRTWSLEKKAWFISRAREKIKSPADRPTTPFSTNVQPFDYFTPAARAIAAELNKGLNSRYAVCKIDICTQGVIYKGELFFWSQKTGYISRGPWTPERGRPLLHHLIWEETNGPVPAQHVVRFIDGNRNNVAPNNLILATKNDVCRESQAKSLLRKSRERTALLLQRAQAKEKQDGLIEQLSRAA